MASVLPMQTQSPISVLLVDDDELSLKVLARRLSQEGFHTVTAASAPAAMDMMERQSFDLVLLDIDMPGMSGIDFLKQLRGNWRADATRVIMLSSNDDAATIKRCLTEGAADYLVKPFILSLARSRIESCLRAAGKQTPTGAGSAPASHSEIRILVVDDDELNRRLLTRQLMQQGFTVMEEGGGKAALQRLQDEPVDMVLLDINMPRRSGTQVLQDIRDNPKTSQMPVIMVSAVSDVETKLACIEAGADGYITKPIDMAALMANIVSTLRVRASNEVEDIDLG
jgi:DNA-binding response OmpR family regulator